MGIAINEAGAIKSLNTSNYGSEMFIDDSLWQDKTLAELGFTEEMCWKGNSNTPTLSNYVGDPAVMYKPFKQYQFGFNPKAIEVDMVPGIYAQRIADSKTYDSPFYKEIPTSNAPYSWSTMPATVFFQMEGLPKRIATDNTNVRQSIHFTGTSYCSLAVINGVFGQLITGNPNQSTNVVEVRFTGVLINSIFTIYAAIGINQSNTKTFQEILQSSRFVGLGNQAMVPIFMIKAYGG